MLNVNQPTPPTRDGGGVSSYLESRVFCTLCSLYRPVCIIILNIPTTLDPLLPPSVKIFHPRVSKIKLRNYLCFILLDDVLLARTAQQSRRRSILSFMRRHEIPDFSLKDACKISKKRRRKLKIPEMIF